MPYPRLSLNIYPPQPLKPSTGGLFFGEKLIHSFGDERSPIEMTGCWGVASGWALLMRRSDPKESEHNPKQIKQQ